MDQLDHRSTPSAPGLTRVVEQLSEHAGTISAELAHERQLPRWLADHLRAAGIFKMLVPAEVGGLEVDPLTAAGLVEKLSRIDASLGWCAMIGAQWGWFSAFVDLAAARHMYGPSDAVGAGALKPGGEAVPVEGGYQVTGRWPLASGCTHASWLHGACVVRGSAPDGSTQPELRVVAVPSDEATILDTWDALGLRATGSHDFTVEAVHVPADRTFPSPRLGTPWCEGPLYRHRLMNVIFVLQGAQAIGTALGALDDFAALASTKTRWASSVPLRDEPAVQARAAKAEAMIRAARAWLTDATCEVWASLSADRPPTMEQRRRLRLAITHAIASCVGAGDALHSAAGSAAVYDGQALERRFRDLRTAGAHVQATPRILEIAGALALGAAIDVNPGLV